jgi:hypothetical protein
MDPFEAAAHEELSELVEIAQVEALDFQELEALELDAVRVLCAELVPLLKHANRSSITQYALSWRWRRYGRKHKTIWLHKDWTTFGNIQRLLYVSDTSELLELSELGANYYVQPLDTACWVIHHRTGP